VVRVVTQAEFEPANFHAAVATVPAVVNLKVAPRAYKVVDDEEE
jgi:hypothetical protein